VIPTRGDDPDLLVDTSDAVGRRRLGLAGHATFETFSVLTRLPGVELEILDP
jgi:hypothetical protein